MLNRIVLFFTLLSSIGISTFAQNKALSLDGYGSWCETKIDGNFLPQTISVWFYCRNINAFGSVIDCDSCGKNGMGLEVNYSRRDPGRLSIDYHNGFFDTGYTIDAYTWYHATLVYTLDDVKLYINGDLTYSALIKKSELDGGLIRLGRHCVEGETNGFFNGLIDEVSIWNMALDEKSVKRYYSKTRLQGSENGLVSYWNFDDGTANDISVNK